MPGVRDDLALPFVRDDLALGVDRDDLALGVDRDDLALPGVSFDSASIPDAPRAEEIVVAVAAATGGRPFPRIGNREIDKNDLAAAK